MADRPRRRKPAGHRVQPGNKAAALARPDGAGELGPGTIAHIQVTQERRRSPRPRPLKNAAATGLFRYKDPSRSSRPAPPWHRCRSGRSAGVQRSAPPERPGRAQHRQSLEHPTSEAAIEMPCGHERGTQLHDQFGGHRGQPRRFGQVFATRSLLRAPARTERARQRSIIEPAHAAGLPAGPVTRPRGSVALRISGCRFASPDGCVGHVVGEHDPAWQRGPERLDRHRPGPPEHPQR